MPGHPASATARAWTHGGTPRLRQQRSLCIWTRTQVRVRARVRVRATVRFRARVRASARARARAS